MTAFSFGVLLFAMCLSAQVHCQNDTSSASLLNHTTAASSASPPSIATNTYSTGVNQTSASGGGAIPQPTACTCLLSFTLATFLLGWC